MSKHDEARTNDQTPESVEERSRRSAREVAEWEADLAAGKPDGNSAPPDDADRANAGAMVSRAHRAEKKTVRPPES